MPGEDILARLQRVSGEGIVSVNTVQQWTSSFRNRKTNLDDEPRRGQPRQNEKLSVIRTIIEENPYLLQKKIVQTLFLDHDIVKR
jgi:transposase